MAMKFPDLLRRLARGAPTGIRPAGPMADKGARAREYSLEAVGWVRVVAGPQALLSVYLLAMWALTQFGRPFE
jgi:hypothetical protein